MDPRDASCTAPTILPKVDWPVTGPTVHSKATTIATNALRMSFLRERTVLGGSGFNLSLGEDSIGSDVWKAGLIHKLSVRSAMFALFCSRCCNEESDAQAWSTLSQLGATKNLRAEKSDLATKALFQRVGW